MKLAPHDCATATSLVVTFAVLEYCSPSMSIAAEGHCPAERVLDFVAAGGEGTDDLGSGAGYRGYRHVVQQLYVARSAVVVHEDQVARDGTGRREADHRGALGPAGGGVGAGLAELVAVGDDRAGRVVELQRQPDGVAGIVPRNQPVAL